MACEGIRPLAVTSSTELLGPQTPSEAKLLSSLRGVVDDDSTVVCAAGAVWQLASLRARRHDLLAARSLLLRYMEWRAANDVDQHTASESLRRQLESGFLRCSGLTDVQGRIIVYVDNAKHDPASFSAAQTVLAVHAVLEYALLRFPAAQTRGIVIVQDLSRMGVSNVDLEVPKALKSAFTDTFPVRVGMFLIYQAPLFVRVAAPVLKAFLSKKLRKRIVLVGPDDITKVRTAGADAATTLAALELWLLPGTPACATHAGHACAPVHCPGTAPGCHRGEHACGNGQHPLR